MNAKGKELLCNLFPPSDGDNSQSVLSDTTLTSEAETNPHQNKPALEISPPSPYGQRARFDSEFTCDSLDQTLVESKLTFTDDPLRDYITMSSRSPTMSDSPVNVNGDNVPCGPPKDFFESFSRKLDCIADDIKDVKVKSQSNFDELKNLYSSLSVQIADSEIKTNQHDFMTIEGRLDELEKGPPVIINGVDDLDSRIDQQVKSSLNEVMSVHLDNLEAKWMKNLNDTIVRMNAKGRSAKRLNVVIKGLPASTYDDKNLVCNYIMEKFGLESGIGEIIIRGTPRVETVTLSDWKTKMDILNRKSELLKNTKIFIDSDLTAREKRCMDKLKSIAWEEKQSGTKVKVRHMIIMKGGNWYGWDEIGQKLIQLEEAVPKQSTRYQKSNSNVNQENFSSRAGQSGLQARTSAEIAAPSSLLSGTRMGRGA